MIVFRKSSLLPGDRDDHMRTPGPITFNRFDRDRNDRGDHMRTRLKDAQCNTK